MHVIIGLIILGFVIMLALFFAQLALTLIMWIIAIPVAGIMWLKEKVTK